MQMSYTDYLAFAPETRIVEWVDGEVINYRPPVAEHQTISGFLGELINSYANTFN